jgi:hypothetical protein
MRSTVMYIKTVGNCRYIYRYIPHIYTDIYQFASTSDEAAACVEAVALHVGKSLLYEPLLHV